MKKNGYYYITTTLPYVNASPHIGFGLEIVTADTLARYHRQLGESVRFNTGTDEHGLKLYQKAVESGESPQEYVDRYAQQFKELIELLNLSNTDFIRTTDPAHMAAAQEFWRRCDKNGDIYKKMYQVKYCVGCELEKTESELNDEGRCPLHPNRELMLIEEENYFFRFSKYQQPLLDFYESHPNFVKPEEKFREIKAFVAQGLQDFSISRLKEKLPWGVPVPDDPDQVMYVWFDALVNYVSTLGWPEESEAFERFWPGVQIAGKDNLRQQSAMWQAMLLSAGLANSKQVLINGFISVKGEKMSKSLGNVVSPTEMVERFGVDGARYLLLRLGPVSGDMDVSWDKFETRYTAELSKGLGNTVQRVASLCERSGLGYEPDTPPGFRSQVKEHMSGDYRLDMALEEIQATVKMLDKRIEEARPWEMEGKTLKSTLMEMVAHLRQVGYELQPFMPETGEKILKTFKGPLIQAPQPLFPRLD